MTRTRLSAALLLAASLAAGPALAQEIGAVGAAAPRITGAPPAAAERALAKGDRVVLNERIRTSDRGVGNLMFDDQTTLSIAPNSDVTLDRYVYDPASETGRMGVSLTKGALRFIGGRITKQTPATVKTQTATIGIRGGMVYVSQRPDGSVRIINLGSLAITIQTAKGALTLARNGAAATVAPDGAITYDGIVSQEALAAAFAEFQVAGGAPSALRGTAIAVRTPETDRQGGASEQPVATDGSDRNPDALDDFPLGPDDAARDAGFGLTPENAPPPAPAPIVDPAPEPEPEPDPIVVADPAPIPDPEPEPDLEPEVDPEETFVEEEEEEGPLQ